MNVNSKMKPCSKFLSLKTAFLGLALALFALSPRAQTVLPLNLPLYFEANNNQTEFRSSGSDYQFLISHDGAQILLSQSAAGIATARMSFPGGNSQAEIHGTGELPGKINYLIGDDSSRWQTGLPTFARVQIADIYPGINLVFHGNQQQLEYDFAIAPGANANAIKIHFDGVENISITPQGDLVLKIGTGKILQPKPEIYQTVAGVRKRLSGGFKILDAQTVAFEVGSYDHSLPLVIDPVLIYSAYFGGNKGTIGWAIAHDTNGFTYIAGQTFSKQFFTTGALQTNFGGGILAGDAFVAKFDSTGANLIYLTYLGGNDNDAAYALAVDGNSEAYIAGATASTNFPTTNAIPGGAQINGKIDPHTGHFPVDAFVTELDAGGSNLIYSTYLGGAAADVAYGIAVDSSDNAYITGFTSSTNFPVYPSQDSVLQNHLACTNSFYSNANAFLTEIAAGGGSVVYSTYLGGTNYDVGRAVAVGANNYVYVAGHTGSTNFPTWNIPAGLSPYLNGVTNKNYHNDNSLDAFVTVFPPLTTLPSSITNLLYSTFLGGTNTDIAYGIAVDTAGNAYVTGSTSSTNFPTTNNPPGLFSFLTTNFNFSGAAISNVFLTKISAPGTNGTEVLDSTVFGGRGKDVGYGVAVDAAGDVFVVGGESSTNFPTMNTASPLSHTNAFRTGSDVFVTAISNDWSRVYYSVLLGGRKDDIGYGIALDSSTNVYITGSTASTNFPTQNIPKFSFNGGNIINGTTNVIDSTKLTGTNEAFLAEIALGTLPTGPTITTPLPAAQTNGLFTTFTLSITATGTPPLIYQWQTTNADGVQTNLNFHDKSRFIGTTSNSLTILDAQLTNSGNYYIIVTNNWGAVTDSIALSIFSFPPQITVPPTNQTVGVGDTVVFPVEATGTAPLHFQWQLNGTNYLHSFDLTNSELILTNVQLNEAGTYSIIVTNDYGSVTDSATLTVLTFAPQIVSAPPLFQTNGLGTAFSLFINATGSPPLIYQWQFNGTNLTSKDKGYTGVNSNALTFTDAQTNQSGNYTVIITNTWGLATTNINETIMPLAPQITTPPASATNGVGNLSYFTVTATGTSPLRYQWQLNGTNLPNKSPYIGATNSTLILTNVQLSEAGTYSIIVTNIYGSASTNASLTVLSFPPVITNASPLFQTNGLGTTFSLFINVTGSPPLIYQWQFNGTNLTSKSKGYTGVNTSSLTFTKAETNQSGIYTVIVTNNFGLATTNINQTIMALAPEITVPPTNQTVGTGNTITFPITATGTPPLRYRWQLNGTNLVNRNGISGVTTKTLKITDAKTNDSGAISIVVTNNYGAVTDSVTLTVAPLPPQITVPPGNQITGAGTNFPATFTVTATGSLPLSYQWQKNGVNLGNQKGIYSGVNSNTFIILNPSTNDDGLYDVVVTNAYGSTTTNALLTVVYMPTLIVPLTNQIAYVGSNVTFSVVAAGSPGADAAPLLYEWFNGAGVITNNDHFSGATNSSLTINDVTTNDQGYYAVYVYYNFQIFTNSDAFLTVTNLSDASTSLHANVFVNPQPFNIKNIVQATGGNGFVISGNGGPANGTYWVLASSNLMAPFSLWTPVTTNQFDSQGNFIFTNTGQTNQQEFYILKHQ